MPVDTKNRKKMRSGLATVLAIIEVTDAAMLSIMQLTKNSTV